MNFRIVKINDDTYEKLFNLSIYDGTKEKLLKNNDMLIIICIE
jgi:hypothetical protein